MIPERQPIGDSFAGVVLQSADIHLLATEPLEDLKIVASGEFTVRYAVPYLGKPHLSIVPGLVALDYGEMLTGEDAWEFLLQRSNLHPRADVVGYRNDGTDDMIVVKLLDLAEPIQVLAYDSATATMPIAPLAALIAADTSRIPSRLTSHLPRFASLADWQSAHHE